MKKVVIVLLVCMVCSTFVGCGLFTEKSETTICDVETTKLEPVCEITLK